jgi:hypothetical protein
MTTLNISASGTKDQVRIELDHMKASADPLKAAVLDALIAHVPDVAGNFVRVSVNGCVSGDE